jgi:hypothetical protein
VEKGECEDEEQAEPGLLGSGVFGAKFGEDGSSSFNFSRQINRTSPVSETRIPSIHRQNNTLTATD